MLLSLPLEEARYSPSHILCRHFNVYIFVIASIQSFTFQIFGVVGPLRENLDFLVRWDLTFKQILNTNKKNQALLSQNFETLSE